MAANNFGLHFISSSLRDGAANSNILASAASLKDLSTFTFEGWIKVATNQSSGNQRFFFIGQGAPAANARPRFAGSAWTASGVGRLRFEFARVDNTNDTNYTYVLPTAWDDYWHHVAFTCHVGDEAYEIYLDGGLVQSGKLVDGGLDEAEAALKVSNTSALGCFLGRGTSGGWWNGKLSNVRLWSNVRSGNLIQENRFDHIVDPGTESGLIEEFRLNEGGAATATFGAKNGTWGFDLFENGGLSSALWTADRPFLGDGVDDTAPPTTPSLNSVTNVTADGFDLGWTSVTDNVYVQYHEVTVATDSAFGNPIAGFAAFNVGLATSVSVRDLSPSTNYYARVRAFDAAGNASAYANYAANPITTSAAGDVTPPTAPAAAAATAITSTSFTANWSAATDDVAVTGYKLDVSTDPTFADTLAFVSGWRNVDVGSVLTKLVDVNIVPSTQHYYRLRAYDAAENESIESNVVAVTTASPPDTTPPDPVIPTPPTSIEARSFTANWNLGVDNVAVVSYRLDVARDLGFTTLVAGYDDRDVGNVTAFGIDDVEPETGYYYRVRAVDAANNVSANYDDPEPVTTLAALVADGELLTVAYEPVADTYTNETVPSTNFGTAEDLVARGGAGQVRTAYLRFDLSAVLGTIVNANLRLYVIEESAGTFDVQVAAGEWDEATLTHSANPLVLSGDTLPISPSVDESWIELDIASLLAGAGIYTVAIHSTSADQAVFSAREGVQIPQLVVESDTESATRTETISAIAEADGIENLLKNPSAEGGVGGATGVVANTAGDTITQDLTYAYEGEYSAKLETGNLVADEGLRFESPTALALAGGAVVNGFVHLRANSAVTLDAVRLRITYTDASTTLGGPTAVTLGTFWRRIALPEVTTTVGKTIDKVEVLVTHTTAQAVTFWADAAVAVIGDAPAGYFDGDYVGGDWNGTVNASTSRFDGARIDLDLSYVGDGNENNEIVEVAYKRDHDDDWITPYLSGVVLDRGTKTIQATFGPTLQGNEVTNPSFTDDAVGWFAHDGTTTITRITTDGVEEAGAEDLACLEVSVDGSATERGVFSAPIAAQVDDTKTYSLYAKSVSGTTALLMKVEMWTAAGVSLGALTQPITITTEWARYELPVTISAGSTEQILVTLYSATAAAGVWRVDRLQVEPGEIANPYVDGDQTDGVWSGNAHQSSTYRIVDNDTAYNVRVALSDADGVNGANPISALVVTPPRADNVLTTAAPLLIAAANARLDVQAFYAGDDDGNATATVEYRRSDLPNWQIVRVSFNRVDKVALAAITNLKPGTSYDVRVTFVDEDGVFGVNPLEATVVTTTDGLVPEGQTRITFGGFVLMGDNQPNFWVTEHDALSHPNRRVQIENMPRTDGAAELSNWWGKRTISMRGGVEGTDRADLEEKVASLRKSLAPKQQRLVIDTLGTRGYYLTATCTSLVIVESANNHTVRHVLWDAEFECADPWRYESADTVDPLIVLIDEDEVAIANGGDLICDAIYTITTDYTGSLGVTLVNTTTGERIRPFGTITRDDVLEIDGRSLSLTKNGVEIDYEGGFPRLSVGTNVLAVRSTNEAISVYLTVRRRHRFM